MKHFKKLQTLAVTAVLGVAVLAAPGLASAAPAPQPPQLGTVSGPQAKPAVEPGTKDAPRLKKLGATSEVKVSQEGTPQAVSAAVAGIGFQTFSNYCYKNLVYTTIKNTTAAAKSVQVRVYNQGSYRDIYTSVAAGATVYPASYGVEGAYTAYLYVWNGSSYAYDEYKAGTNTCAVSVTRTSNAGGWVQLKIQNTGTAYASQQTRELAPYPAAGTYTGTHYDYPVAGGAAIYRWFQVGTSPYAIVSDTLNSTISPYFFTGDL